MHKLLVLVLLVAAFLVATPAEAFRGIGWNYTQQLPEFNQGGFCVKASDTIKIGSTTIATFASDGTVTWATVPTYSGSPVFSADITVTDEIYMYEAGGTLKSNKIDVDGDEAFNFYGPTNPASLANNQCMKISTSTVTFYDGITMSAGKAFTAPDTSYFTQIRIGTGSTPTNNSATAADGLFVEGVIEADGAAQFDGVITATADVDLSATGGSSADGDFTVAGYAIHNGNLQLTDDDLIIGDGSNLAFGIDAASDVLRVYGSTNPASLRNIQVMGITTAATTFYKGVTFTAAQVITCPDTAYFTQLRIGTGSTPTNNSATAADGFFCEGVGEFDGALRADNGLTVAGAAVSLGSGSTVLKRVWIPATAMYASAATAATTGSVRGYSLADSGADEHLFCTWVVPQDCDVSSDAELYYVYTPASDVGANTEGKWNCQINTMSDGSTVAAAATALEIVYDTPQGGQGDGSSAKWNVTTSATIPNTSITVDSVINLDIYHDVTDPFGNEPILAGVWIEYVSNKLGE